MGRKVINGVEINTNVKRSRVQPPQFSCCPEWSVLGVDQYALKDVNEDSGAFTQRPLINFASKPFGIPIGGDPIIKTDVLFSEIKSTGSGSQYIEFNSLGGSTFYLYIFNIQPYNAILKYYDSICIYFKSFGNGPEVEFTLQRDHSNSQGSIIAQSGVISTTTYNSTMQKVEIPIPESEFFSPVRIRVDRNSSVFELHDMRICDTNGLVFWAAPFIGVGGGDFGGNFPPS